MGSSPPSWRPTRKRGERKPQRGSFLLLFTEEKLANTLQANAKCVSKRWHVKPKLWFQKQGQSGWGCARRDSGPNSVTQKRWDKVRYHTDKPLCARHGPSWWRRGGETLCPVNYPANTCPPWLPWGKAHATHAQNLSPKEKFWGPEMQSSLPHTQDRPTASSWFREKLPAFKSKYLKRNQHRVHTKNTREKEERKKRNK